MKTKNIFMYRLALLCGLISTMSLFACLDDSDETIALEEGNTPELLLGTWNVEKSELYDITSERYHSDLPDDNSLSNLYNIGVDGVGLLYSNGETEDILWSLNDMNQVLTINGDVYKLASLGEKVMVWESRRSVNGDNYIHRYTLRKTGDWEYDINNSGNPEENVESENKTQTVSSDESGIYSLYGYTVIVPKGAVPRTNSGDIGKVVFSIQLTDDLPAGLPQGTTLLEQGNVKIEPMNFTFNSPLTVKIPLRGYSASDVQVYWYNAYTGSWVLVPFSKINSDGTASISVIELGQFIVVRNATGTGTSQLSTGGIHIASQYIQSGYYYYLTLTPQGSSTGTKSIAFTSNGEDLYMAGIARGTYSVTITRERRSAVSSDAATIESAYLQNVSVTQLLTKGNGGYNTYTGWTELSLNNVSWSSGRPGIWGEATKTYGTGKFQATLTWVNTSSSRTDYDLHLTTPLGEVYYGAKQIGAFELDRDWTTPAGNAIENIYSIRDNFASGTYKVRVHHYSGVVGKSYNCRIIVNGTVVKSVTQTINTNNVYNDIYTFTIQ